ncbi:MAG: penicillin acylase family protein [Pseudomonadota bacterium]
MAPGRLKSTLGSLVSGAIIVCVTASNAMALDEEEETLKGLQAKAEILIDRWGIAHIYAQNERDAFFLQGYNAARDRLWQIDLWRRRGLGLLAEVFGKKYVLHDRAARLFLFRGDIDKEFAAYGPNAKSTIEAFTAGINQYIDSLEEHPQRMPVEFALAGYTPQRWKASDIVRIRTHGIALNAAFELQRAKTLCDHGEEAEALRVRLQPPWKVRKPNGLELCDLPIEIVSTYGLARRALLDVTDLPQAPGGSNNWAVSASRSSTGRAVIANDPHRPLSLPSLRYLSHVEAPGLRFAGAGEPFTPGVSIGHNGNIAFGLTVQFVDQEDIYIYELHPEKDDHYRYKSGWNRFTEIIQHIPVGGADPQEIRLQFSRHGPILHLDLKKRRAYGIRSMQLEVGTAPYLGSLNFLRAKDINGAVASLTSWGGPGENMVFGDTSGQIAWQVAAFVPQRPNWDGLLPVLGSGDYEWDGYIRSDQLPGVVQPESGILVTANEMNFPDGYPYAERKTGFEFVDSARAERIREVLQGHGKIPFDIHLELQNDLLSVPARDLITRLRTVDPTEAEDKRLIGRFRGWDFRMVENSPAAALYAFWMRRTLPAAIYAALLQESPPSGFTIHMVVVRDILRDASTATNGTLDRASLDAILLRSLRDAAEKLAAYQSTESVGQRWGDIQSLDLKHTLHSLLRNNGYDCPQAYGQSRGGSQHTVDVTYSGHDFKVKAGSAPRIVVDVGEWDNTKVMNLPGQSGDPRSEHYCDLTVPWRNGEYVPLLFSREAVKAAASQSLTFHPARVDLR